MKIARRKFPYRTYDAVSFFWRTTRTRDWRSISKAHCGCIYCTKTDRYGQVHWFEGYLLHRPEGDVIWNQLNGEDQEISVKWVHLWTYCIYGNRSRKAEKRFAEDMTDCSFLRNDQRRVRRTQNMSGFWG